MIFKLPNPVPFTPRHHEDVGEVFGRFAIMPYYGTNETASHHFLDLLDTLAELSPTFRSVRTDLLAYTFGNRTSVVGRARPGLALETTELEPAAQLAYEDYLSQLGIRFNGVMKITRRLDHFLAVSGNAYLVIRRIRVGDTVRYTFKAPHYKHVAYLTNERDPTEEFIIISKFIRSLDLLEKYPPKILLATQDGEPLRWAQTEPGIEEAVIHIKKDNDVDESDFYARSDLLGVLTWMYTDYQLGSLSSKIAATDLISKKIIAFEGAEEDLEIDPEDLDELSADGYIGAKRKDRFERNMLVLKELTTNLGKHPSAAGTEKAVGTIAGIEYPPGKNPPTPIDLEVNKDPEYQRWQLDTAIREIASSQGWAPELINLRPTETQLGGNLWYDMFITKNITTIQPRQRKFEDFWNETLAQIIEQEGGPDEFIGYGIEYPNVIDEMIERLRSSATPPSMNVNLQGQNQATINEQNQNDDGNE